MPNSARNPRDLAKLKADIRHHAEHIRIQIAEFDNLDLPGDSDYIAASLEMLETYASILAMRCQRSLREIAKAKA
jgi:hypothetical protein